MNADIEWQILPQFAHLWAIFGVCFSAFLETGVLEHKHFVLVWATLTSNLHVDGTFTKWITAPAEGLKSVGVAL